MDLQTNELEKTEVFNFSFQTEVTQQFYARLFSECIEMAQYALSQGLEVSPNVIRVIEGSDLSTEETAQYARDLVVLHNQLSRLIAPVKPTTLPQRVGRTEKRFLSMIGPSIVPQLMGWAFFFMLVFISTSLTSYIDETNIELDFTGNQGIPLLVNFLFLLSAAGLGATFSALFKANRYISRHTFDPKHVSSYYIQLMLGVIAGLFISQLFDFDQSADTINFLSKPTLALLGGFSSTVVYRLLKQLLAALETLVKGDAEDLIESQRQLLQIDAKQTIQEERMKIAAELVSLKDELVSNHDSNPEDLQRILNESLNGILEAA